MSLKVRLSPPARRDLKRLDAPVRRRVVEALEQYGEKGQGDVKRLQNVSPPEYRLRVGGWRVRFLVDDAAEELYVLRVLSRDKAYR